MRLNPAPLLAFTLVTAALLAGCTSAPTSTSGTAADTDGDGLPDEEEIRGWEVTVRGLASNTTLKVTSDPAVADTDGDGLSDREERLKGLNPREVDTDGDGLLDGKNVQDPALIGRNLIEDPPGTFLGEADQCLEVGGLDPLRVDSDTPVGDGIPDGDELRGWEVTIRGETRRVQSSPCRPDTDQDGLWDPVEREMGTDPTSRDTDADGVLDLVDADPLWNLGVTLTGNTWTPGENATGDSTLRLHLEDETRAYALAHGDVEVSLVADVDDSTDEAGHLWKQVLLRVEGPDGPRDLGNGPDPVAVRYDALTGAWETNRASGTNGAVTVSGPDGTLTLTLTTTRA